MSELGSSKLKKLLPIVQKKSSPFILKSTAYVSRFPTLHLATKYSNSMMASHFVSWVPGLGCVDLMALMTDLMKHDGIIGDC